MLYNVEKVSNSDKNLRRIIISKIQSFLACISSLFWFHGAFILWIGLSTQINPGPRGCRQQTSLTFSSYTVQSQLDNI